MGTAVPQPARKGGEEGMGTKGKKANNGNDLGKKTNLVF